MARHFRRHRRGRPQVVQTVICPKCRLANRITYEPYDGEILIACGACKAPLNVDLSVPVLPL